MPRPEALHSAGGIFIRAGPRSNRGHVGIVYSFEDDGTWWLIQGGQGGPGGRVDYIRWKNTKFDRTKINGWINIAKYLMPNGPARSAATHEYQSAR